MDKFQHYREELDKLIEEHEYNMSDEAVVKKSLELENLMYGFSSESQRY